MHLVALSLDRTDPIATAEPVARSVDRLRALLRGRDVHLEDDEVVAGSGASTVAFRGPSTPGGSRDPLERHLPHEPEAFAVVTESGERTTAFGADVRGLVYAVLELADRVEHGQDPIAALRPEGPIVACPRNRTRSVARLFCSEVEDVGWFRDQGWWRRYLSMLVSQRFNRVNLTLGLGYNYPRGVTDAYLYFAYPFLLAVPGHAARVVQLPDEEREGNLAALRFASEEAAAVGLEFQLGLWTHAYDWLESPDAHQTVEGLTPETHAAYCRDAVRELLSRCPAVTGLTFRTHGESGIPERSWDFWRTVFDGTRDARRPIRIDLHAKGLDAPTLESALDTGHPVTVSPKFWAEHMGLPYHQAAIRELERPEREDPSGRSEWHRYMAVSEGSRPFTRYGYGDFLREDRPYAIVFRLWAGTQRLLLWGDPAFAAGYGRASSIAGADGLEWCEPLTFKGREGTGIGGSRTAYADASLVPPDDWQKFAYAYRLFGRLTYDPDASPEAWRRALRRTHGAAADEAEAALGAASRILPLVTTAHHPSASNNYFWPEIYTDMPIVWSGETIRDHPYLDTPLPRRFGTVSPLDPEVFSSVTECIDELLTGERSGRYSPMDVASWLEGLSSDAERHLEAIRARESGSEAERRRWLTDVAIVAGLGRSFAGKMRAAVDFERHAATGSRRDLEAAVVACRSAVDAWRRVVAAADVYVDDLTFGPQPWLRGHWRDRIPAIEADLADMEDRLRSLDGAVGEETIHVVERPSAGPPPDIDVLHAPPTHYVTGADVNLELRVGGREAATVGAVTLRFRRMNQALTYASTPMARSGPAFAGRIPAEHADGVYPLAYAFVLRTVDGTAWRHPGLGDDLSSQPYHVLRRAL